ncbi:MAG: hypothetical protein AB1Z67_00645 [Candidatus Limnocylindrales bacterium]
MSASERTITVLLVAAAIAAWFVVAFVLGFVSPENDAGAQLGGAIAFGAAVTLTLWPLLWSATRTRPGSLATSARRSLLAGSVVSILVVLRAIDVVSPVVVVSVIVGAIVIEAAVALRR